MQLWEKYSDLLNLSFLVYKTGVVKRAPLLGEHGIDRRNNIRQGARGARPDGAGLCHFLGSCFACSSHGASLDLLPPTWERKDKDSSAMAFRYENTGDNNFKYKCKIS